MKINHSLSIQTVDRLQALGKWDPANCWDNAIFAVLNMLGGEAKYVEGYVEVDGKVITHGWAEVEGKVVETTNGHKLDANRRHKPVTTFSKSMLRYMISQEQGPTISLPFTKFIELEDDVERP